MKATIYQKVSLEKLGRVLPQAFKIPLPPDLTEPVTAVVFRDEVVTGRVARKAIERIGTDFGASLLFAARDFTCEATDLASSRGITIITPTGYQHFWSDESLVEIRTFIATHRPLQ